MDSHSECGSFLAQLDAAEVEAFDALLLLGKTCSVRFTTDTNQQVPALIKDVTESTPNEQDSPQYQDSTEEEEEHLYEEDDDDEEFDEMDDDEDFDEDEDDDSAEPPHALSQRAHNQASNMDDHAILTGDGAANNNRLLHAANKRKLKRCKRQRRKRRRSLAWDRSHIADSCKEAMRRVRAYLHTQKHTPLPSYVVPISDVHSFFGIMYMNILNLGDLKLVHRFFEHFASSRVSLYTYDRVEHANNSDNNNNKIEKAKNIWKVKGGDLIALYFAYFYETSPDIVAKLKECHIIPVPADLNAQLHHHHHHQYNTANCITTIGMPLPLPSPRNLPMSNNNNNNSENHAYNTSDSLSRNNSNHSLSTATLTAHTVPLPAATTTSTTSSSRSRSSSTPFALNDYICCVQLDLQVLGTRLFENDVNTFKSIIERDNPLQTPHQRLAWSQTRIEDYFQQSLQPLKVPIVYSFDSRVRMYVNCRRKVDRIEVVRSFHNDWL